MRTLTKIIQTASLLSLLGTSLLGCAATDGPGQNASDGDVGRLDLALAFPPDVDDVAAVLFEVTNEDGDVQAATIPLRGERLPAEVDPDLAGHAFADWFVVLNPGNYRVRATPLDTDDNPSEQCAPVEGDATVLAGVTTEIVLVSGCGEEGSGGLDVVVVLNRPPFIEELEFDPSKFVCAGEVARIIATVSDPDGDDVSGEWEIFVSSDGLASVPDGATEDDYNLTSDGLRASFSSAVPGRYELAVTVTDGRATTVLVLPIYVLDCDDGPQLIANGSFERGSGMNILNWVPQEYAPSDFAGVGDVPLDAPAGCGFGPSANPDFPSFAQRTRAASFRGAFAVDLRAAVSCGSPDASEAFRWRAAVRIDDVPVPNGSPHVTFWVRTAGGNTCSVPAGGALCLPYDCARGDAYNSQHVIGLLFGTGDSGGNIVDRQRVAVESIEPAAGLCFSHVTDSPADPSHRALFDAANESTTGADGAIWYRYTVAVPSDHVGQTTSVSVLVDHAQNGTGTGTTSIFVDDVAITDAAGDPL